MNMIVSGHWADNIVQLPLNEVTDLDDYRIDLTELDIEYFTKLVHSIVYQGTTIQFNDKIKAIVHNPYNTILNEWARGNSRRDKWEAFIKQSKLKTAEKFNQWCEEEKYAMLFQEDDNVLNFKRDPRFNLVFSYNKISYSMDVYAKVDLNSCKVFLLCNLNDMNASKTIYQYLKLHIRLSNLINVTSEKKTYDTILKEVSMGYHTDTIQPIIMSNNNNVWCLSHVPLIYNKPGKTKAWDTFIQQFENQYMQQEFMRWCYGIFVDDDFDRRVMWIEGDNETGKTTILNILSDYLATFGDFLVGAIAEQKYYNQFTMASLSKCRLAIYADAKESYFFKRRDIMNLTGKDTILIEEKFKTPEKKRVFVKIAVSSNLSPNINYDNGFEVSRLLHIKLDKEKSDLAKKNRTMTLNGFVDALMNEIPTFLSNCKLIYEDFNNVKI